MKKHLIRVLSVLMLAGILSTASSWAGQVVTNDIKSWAKKAVEQEKTLSTATAPHNSVAVLYFNNKTAKSDLDLLEKGLTLMLITDLHKVKGIQLVERVKLEALINEMKLSKSKLTDKEYSARMGKLLGAANLVGGDILGGKQKHFQVASNLLSVKDQKIFGKPEVEGKLLDELFKMEKALLFDIIKSLKIQLTDEERIELGKPFTTSIRALVYYIKAVEYSDQQEYAKAQEYYQKALAEDSGFDMAKMSLEELKDLDLYVPYAEAYEEPEGDEEDISFESKGPRNNEDIRDRSEVEGRLNGTLEIMLNFDPFDSLTDEMVVDFDGIRGEIKKTFGDDAELSAIAGGKYVGGDFDSAGVWTSSDAYTFWSGGYTYGFQTVGQNIMYDANGNIISMTPVFFEPGSLELSGSLQPLVNRTAFAETYGVLSNGFFAYAVQLEEDRMNRKILEMFDDSVTDADVLDSINTALTKGSIRDRDGWFIQNADAQAGRVLRDNNGDMTRVQQYVLRPAPDQVQLFNVCLRKDGPHAGFSSMVWTTQLNDGYTGDLRDLPWNSWLKTIPYDGNFIFTPEDNYPGVLPTMMSVEFKNPANDIFKESRDFGSAPEPYSGYYRQQITGETLELTNGTTGGLTLYEGYNVDRDGPGTNEYNFSGYVLNNDDQTRINVFFSVLADTAGQETPDTPQFFDIWDAMRVNDPARYDYYDQQIIPDIGNNCLGIEIYTDSALLSAPINVVYIPMPRMLWKDE